jgi:hypothetical protein
MIRLRTWSALILAIGLTPALGSQNKGTTTWVVDRTLSVTPQSAPVPALSYRLLPLAWELKEGNAVPIYLRLVHEQNDAARRALAETPMGWNDLPVDKVPLAEARKFLQGRPYLLRQLELGARRRTADWEYTIEEPNPIGLLLPDVQVMRSYGHILILQARVALADADFKAAAHHLETGFGLSRHVAEGPTLIQSMVAIYLASQCAGTVADFIERPGSPNLYWALTALPRPLIDLRRGLDFEYQMLEKQFPELADLDRQRTAEQWDSDLRRVRTELQALAGLPMEGGKQKHADWFPKDWAPGDPAAKSPELPAARRFVAQNKGLSAEKVLTMPPAQVLILYIAGTYHEDRDDWHRAAYLPYPQARPQFEAAAKRLRQQPISEAHLPARLFLSALDKVANSQVRLERNLAALRVVEALRMYAAAHDGKLPDKLADVTEVPIPDDPGTGKAFEYSRAGDTATVVSQIAAEPQAASGIRYRVSIRKK